MSLYHSLNIGNVSLKGNLFLAPLAGYTDRIYRSICLEKGASLAYTEMVSSEGVARKSQKTVDLMTRGRGEDNLAVQLFMPDSDTAKRSVEGVLEYKPQIIDINCGCPVPKVTKTGCGSALLNKPETIGEIVRTLVEETKLPVSVKIRKGWDFNSINYIECAKAAFDNGASSICMHARTKTQLYMPSADWSSLKDLKDHFKDRIIIGSGDLFTAEDGVRMLKETGVDGIVFARGAIGNPFIFEQAKSLIERGETFEPTVEEKKKAILTQLRGLSDIMGENQACREMRKHVCAYIKGIPNGSKVKNSVSQALSVDDYEASLDLLSD